MDYVGALDRLQAWYLAHCNGDWEHSSGVEISTLDNPGWRVKIDLADTDLSDRSFELVEIERSDRDWLRCWIADLTFQVACGPLNLTEGLEFFLRWAEPPPL